MTKKKSGAGVQLGTVLALVVMCAFLAIADKNFYSYSNIMSIFKQTAFNAFLAVGMLLCLITAGIDLSVGANAIFCACLMGALKNAGLTNGILLMIIAVLAGGVMGLINGTLLTRLHLPHPFVSTLGMKNVLWGLALLVTGNQMINNFPDSVTFLGYRTVGGTTSNNGFPVSFIVVLILYVIMHVFLTRTALGRSIYCAGGNMEATRLSGINTANVLTFCYTLSGVTAALGGIVSVGRSGICNGSMANYAYDTDAIAACIIGGASFTGGKGTIWGTLIGAMIMAVIRNGLNLMGASNDLQYIVIGAVIILAVTIDVVRNKMEANARKMAAQ